MSRDPLNRQADDSAFRDDAASSFTMPARFYLDESIYEAEKNAIFFNSWWYAGHVSQVAKSGDYLTAAVHDQNVFVTRDQGNQLHGFYNVCQHRGHELLEGAGNVRAIICPYHAWTYGLDGTLQGARNTNNVDGFNRCEFSLKAVQVEVFCGMVFVNLNPDATSLHEQSGDLEKEIREFCPGVDNLRFAQRDTYEATCNWKVMIDNFLECYHCAPAHRDFVDLVDMDSYKSTTHGIYSSHVSHAAKSTENTAYKFEKGDVDFGYAGWFLWPNLTIWAYPGDANLSILQMNPLTPEKTLEFQDWFVPDGVPSPQLKDAMDYQKDILQPEDIGLCESVHRGLKSRGYNQGRFVVDRARSELSEHAVHHFQSLVVNALDAKLHD